MRAYIFNKQMFIIMLMLGLALSFNIRGTCEQCKKVLDEFNKLMHEYVNVSKELRAQIDANIKNSDRIRKMQGE